MCGSVNGLVCRFPSHGHHGDHVEPTIYARTLRGVSALGREREMMQEYRNNQMNRELYEVLQISI
jgi:hypothetical protein